MKQKCKKRGSSLTAKQKAAAEHFALHGDKTAAYKSAYSCGNAKPATNQKAAHRTFNLPHVKAYVENLQAKAQTAAVVKRSEALELLSEFARASDLETKERMTALQHLAKLQGWEAAQKLDIQGRVTFNLNLTGEK